MHIAPEFQDIFGGKESLMGGKGRTILCLRRDHTVSTKKKTTRKVYSLWFIVDLYIIYRISDILI